MSVEIKLFEPKTAEGNAKGGEREICWTATTARWDNDRIQTIVDPQGASLQRKITSYPTPLARMHLFDDAFGFVLEKAKNDAEGIYDKIVSDCLDVWEILFFNDLFENKLNFIEWNYSKIEDLLNSSHKGHRLLGETLDLYLQRDSIPEFHKIDRFYLISYEGCYFAASSPLTGFFTTSQGVDNLKIPIPGSPNVHYFEEIRAFHTRNESFKLFMERMFAYYRLNNHFESLHKYIRKQSSNLKVWNESPQDLLSKIEQNYTPLISKDDQKIRLLNNVPNLDVVIRKATLRFADSDFIIDSPLNQHNVLAIKSFPDGRPFKHLAIGIRWDNDTVVNDYNEEGDIFNRILPTVGLKHPYIIPGDFLEEYMVELPYAINSDYFITGSTKDSKYLVPVKPLYFEYFTVDDLKNNLSINHIGNSENEKEVIVNLLIPIKSGEKLSFTKRYKVFERPPSISEIRKFFQGRGHIIKYELGMLLFPFFKARKPYERYNDYYKIGCIDGSKGIKSEATFDFYIGKDRINVVGLENHTGVLLKERTKKTNVFTGSKYYEVSGTSFDHIQASVEIEGLGQNAKALIVPDWSVTTSTQIGFNNFEFAIDFGTTNSHVAYKKNNGSPVSLSISENEQLVIRLDKIPLNTASGLSETEKFDTDLISQNIITETIKKQRHEFIPSIIGDRYKLPLTTAVSHADNVASALDLNLLGNLNIAFSFPKRFDIQVKNEIHTNLKWESDQAAKRRTELFLKELLLLIKYKVLKHGGNPSETKITWFAPLSMPEALVNQLSQTWSELYMQVFKTDNADNVNQMTESEAPFHALNIQGALDGNKVLCIDIGGGTTDVLLFNGINIQLGTSFRCAANAVFGDFTDQTAEKGNAFVKHYKEKIKSTLQNLIELAKGVDTPNQERLLELMNCYNWYFDKGNKFRSTDVINFFFTLSDISFEKELKDSGQLKMAFLLFMAGIHYHCAYILKQESFGLPTDIYMSGNGSRIFRLITNDEKDLNAFIKGIYYKVLQEDRHKGISLHFPPDPKEMTCHGALERGDQIGNRSPSDYIKVHLGEQIKGMHGDVSAIKYKDLVNTEIDIKNSEFAKFIHLFFELFNDENFGRKFGIQFQDNEVLKQFLLRRIQENYSKGINWQLSSKQISRDERIKENVFIYPLMGAIHDLTQELIRPEEERELSNS